jgi:hypothetical protein
MDEEVNKSYDNFKQFYELIQDYDKIIRGSGGKEDPARTCKELFQWFPEKKTGDYWIDPNEGSHLDAVLVMCNHTSQETCIYPRSPVMDRDNWVTDGKDRYIWSFKDILEEENIEYAADIYQMKMMKLLSNHARQTITYNCMNSRAIVKLLSDNDLEMHSQSKASLRPQVVLDQCKEAKDDSWKQTVFQVSTDKVERLPIQDIAAYDVADDNEQFGVEVGPVCFS